MSIAEEAFELWYAEYIRAGWNVSKAACRAAYYAALTRMGEEVTEANGCCGCPRVDRVVERYTV